MVTSLGCDWAKNALGFRVGRRAFQPVTLFDVSRQRVKVAGQVDMPEGFPKSLLTSKNVGRLSRAAKLLLFAASEAWEQSGWNTGGCLPVVLGTTSGGMSFGEEYYRQAIEGSGNHRRQPVRVIHYQSQRQGLDLQDAFGFRGPIIIIANACASGANALGHAFDLIRRGQAERVLTGGYDGLSQLVFAGFDSLHALSPTLCRPFDARRDGLALGEGAAVFALETLEYAEKRGARVLAEIVGYGATTDVHHLTQPHPDGVAAHASMKAACVDAQVTPAQIDYVNAHGTGTPLNDSAEAAAITRWAGPHAAALPVSSTKASVGHLLGAAGAVEVGVCVMALEGQWLPPTTSVGELDAACGFSIVRLATNAKVEYAMTNSFGFGGANASLILRRWP